MPIVPTDSSADGRPCRGIHLSRRQIDQTRGERSEPRQRDRRPSCNPRALALPARVHQRGRRPSCNQFSRFAAERTNRGAVGASHRRIASQFDDTSSLLCSLRVRADRVAIGPERGPEGAERSNQLNHSRASPATQ